MRTGTKKFFQAHCRQVFRMSSLTVPQGYVTQTSHFLTRGISGP